MTVTSRTMNGAEGKNSTKNKGEKSRESFQANEGDDREEETDDTVERIYRQVPEIFLLNNILMSVQFFENYERDIRRLREDWFKDIALAKHHKKCFFADSLLRLAGENIKFIPRHGVNKSSETTLHPLRIYISSDHIEAAFDPSALQTNESRHCPRYQFTVGADDKGRKTGCIQLIEHRADKPSNKSLKAATPRTDFPKPCDTAATDGKPEQKQSHFHWRRKSNLFPKPTRRLTKTEKFIGFQNNQRPGERRGSLNYFPGNTQSVISLGDFYKFMSPEARMKPTNIQDFRMCSALSTSCQIPLPCFQMQEVKLPFNAERRRGLVKNELSSVFKSQNVLNWAAFKGYFCDLLIDRLAGTLSLDNSAVSNGFVLGEFIMVNQSGKQFGIAPVIPIRDWNKFIKINERIMRREKEEGLEWPSSFMRKIINILPCNAVPTGHSNTSEENPDYEKEWMLVFPKAEEFLLLHMMHAHVRCYFFALLIYKSFLETEVNVGSFGPKHLLHLLFWRVQRNFLAWPEDRPGETLLLYLKALYKKIQNKHLRDFFVTSRNMFASSLPKDLHKAQSLIKRVIENPVPCVMRALRNLQLKHSFYPTLDVLKLNHILSLPNTPGKPTKIKREKKQKVVRFRKDDDDGDDDDEERQWKKNAIRQIELERKFNEEQHPKLSVESINIDEELRFDTGNATKCTAVLEMFLSHFLEMREKSLEFEFSSQALSYSSHAEKLFDLIVSSGGKIADMKALKAKLNKREKRINALKAKETNEDVTANQDSRESANRGQPLDNPVCKSIQPQQEFVRGNATAKEGEIINKKVAKQKTEWSNSNSDATDEEIYETKL